MGNKMTREPSDQMKRTWEFLIKYEKENRHFTFDEIKQESGYTTSAMKANISKKLKDFVKKVDGEYEAVGIQNVPLDAFTRICSQSSKKSRDPYKPELIPKVEERVLKARDAALAAVQHYNNPTASFKSDTYIVLMIIALTSLFHALCEREGIEYIEKKKDGTPKLTGSGDPLLFDALACAKKLTNYVTPPMIKNLEFMMGLRHKIEHRCVPQIDADIAGHCQSMLLYFEKILTEQFTKYYSLNASLCFPLFFSTERSQETINSMRAFQSAEYENIVKYINDFEANLSDEILESQEFAFRVFLIPMSVNNIRKGDKSIEFIPLDKCSKELNNELDKCFVAYKTKYQDVIHAYDMRPSEVCKQIEMKTNKKFTIKMHTDAWKKHNVRPPSDDINKTVTNAKYCKYDRAHNDYLYTEEWVNLLISEINNNSEIIT